jgi:hypothetical protein
MQTEWKDTAVTVLAASMCIYLLENCNSCGGPSRTIGDSLEKQNNKFCHEVARVSEERTGSENSTCNQGDWARASTAADNLATESLPVHLLFDFLNPRRSLWDTPYWVNSTRSRN